MSINIVPVIIVALSASPSFYMWKKTDEPTYLLLQKTDKPWNYTGGGKTLKGNKTIEIISIR
ncbi:hypothetical protein OAQ34_08705 [Opitutales bacterium]|nr:hypothetical protein [Opitutales bacterium]